MREKIKASFTFFFICLMLGTTCFGGGYAMIPIMEKEFATKRKYVTTEEIWNILTVAQSLPGLISMNTIIILAYRKGGFFCVLMGVLGLVLPALIVICAVAMFYSFFSTNMYVAAVLKGVKAAVIGILISAVVTLVKSSLKNALCYIILFASFFVTLFTELHPLWLIVVGGIVMLIYAEIKDRSNKISNKMKCESKQSKDVAENENLQSAHEKEDSENREEKTEKVLGEDKTKKTEKGSFNDKTSSEEVEK